MSSRVFIWLFAVFTLGGALAQERVILQLPLVPKDKALFKVTKHAMNGEYVEYNITSKRKSQFIREVNFASFNMFHVTDDCDRRIRDRAVTVTLTAHGIFVKVISCTLHASAYEYYKVGEDGVYEFASPADYSRFVRPLSNKNILGIAFFPYTMVAFLPVFKRPLREKRYYLCNEYTFREAIDREDELLAAQNAKSKFIIQSIEPIQRLSFPIPKARALNETKQIYKEFRHDNVSQRRFSKFIPVNMNTLSEYPSCATPSHATVYYMTALGKPVVGYM